MDYTKEAREVKHSYYGWYCELCRNHKIKPVPFHSFTLEEYERVSKLSK